MVRTLRPDILLLDLAMPKMPGLELMREMTADGGDTRTIVLTGQVDKRQILEALQLGARGVVLKDAIVAHLSACIRAVMQGQLARRPARCRIWCRCCATWRPRSRHRPARPSD